MNPLKIQSSHVISAVAQFTKKACDTIALSATHFALLLGSPSLYVCRHAHMKEFALLLGSPSLYVCRHAHMKEFALLLQNPSLYVCVL
jgi:hypothetical protein